MQSKTQPSMDSTAAAKMKGEGFRDQRGGAQSHLHRFTCGGRHAVSGRAIRYVTLSQ
jgi:hypothetical protein